MDPSRMSVQELLQLYRGVDMEPFGRIHQQAYAGAGPGARIGETDDMVIIEDEDSIDFYPTDDDHTWVQLQITRYDGGV